MKLAGTGSFAAIIVLASSVSGHAQSLTQLSALEKAAPVQQLISNTGKHIEDRESDSFWVMAGMTPPKARVWLKLIPRAKVILAKPIAYQAFRDTRPHEFEKCFFGAEIEITRNGVSFHLRRAGSDRQGHHGAAVVCRDPGDVRRRGGDRAHRQGSRRGCSTLPEGRVDDCRNWCR